MTLTYVYYACIVSAFFSIASAVGTWRWSMRAVRAAVKLEVHEEAMKRLLDSAARHMGGMEIVHDQKDEGRP